MQLFGILTSLIVLCCCLSINAQQLDCRRLRERCDVCIRNLNDNSNQLPNFNRTCRQKTLRTWIWRNINRCQLEEIACSAQRRRMDCGVVAEIAGMQRRV